MILFNMYLFCTKSSIIHENLACKHEESGILTTALHPTDYEEQVHSQQSLIRNNYNFKVP